MSAAVQWLMNAFPGLHAAQVARAYRRVFGRDDLSRDGRLILDDLALYCGLRRTGMRVRRRPSFWQPRSTRTNSISPA